jgi:hypothetical protein
METTNYYGVVQSPDHITLEEAQQYDQMFTDMKQGKIKPYIEPKSVIDNNGYKAILNALEGLKNDLTPVNKFFTKVDKSQKVGKKDEVVELTERELRAIERQTKITQRIIKKGV